MYSKKLIIFNFIGFQLLWWASVLSAKPQLSWAVLALVVVLACVHLHWIEGWKQTLPLLMTTLIGCILDQFGYYMGWVNFEFHSVFTAYIPLWMIALWLAFSMTVNVSMRWLQGKNALAVFLGAVFGPLAYVGAQQLQVVTLPFGALSLIWVAVEWALAMPMLLWVRQQFNHDVNMELP